MNRSARSMSPFGRSGLRRRGSSKILVIGAALTLCLSALAAASEVAAAADIGFERFDVELGAGQEPTIITGFFMPGAMANLAVISINNQGERRLRIYGFDGTGWVREHATLLRPEVLFVDVAEIGGRDRLITWPRCSTRYRSKSKVLGVSATACSSCAEKSSRLRVSRLNAPKL